MSCPDSIHDEPDGLFLTRDADEPSIAKRDYNFVGNRQNKEYLQGGIAIFENADQLAPMDKDKTLMGQQTLSEV